jgi:cytochrome c-type biogenesis protein CcmE
MKPKHQRLVLLSLVLLGLSLSLGFMLVALQENIVFFYTPSDLLNKTTPPQQRLRIGGLVEKSSLRQQGDMVHFNITDQKKTIAVSYKGVLPDLFREGQGVVAEGYLTSPQHFQAATVLAKHDETYMPKEVADHLKKTGQGRDAHPPHRHREPPQGAWRSRGRKELDCDVEPTALLAMTRLFLGELHAQ